MKLKNMFGSFALGVTIATVGSLGAMWSPPASAMQKLHNCSLNTACVQVGDGPTTCETWIDCDEGSWRVG